MMERPQLDRSNSMAIINASRELPPIPEPLLAHATHVLSEWLNDSAPLGEGRYRSPAEAVLKLAAIYADMLPKAP